jgi:hypothetical protein
MTRKNIAVFTSAMITLFAVLAGNAVAADPPATSPARPSCIDTKQSYVARPLSANQIWVQNSLGTKKPPVRVTTSCYHLQSADGFGLSAQFTCLAQGDTVSANILGDREGCIVTKVQVYVPQDGDLPEKK